MKILPTEFTADKFNFKQIKREGDCAIFRKTKTGQTTESYEVVRIQRYPTYTIAGIEIPAHESLPGSNQWGENGFTYTDLDRAKNKFCSLFSDTPTSTIVGEAKGTARGRKRSDFELEIPTDREFTVKELAEKYPDKSVPFIHLRLNELKEKGAVKVVRTEKTESGRGKPSNIYKAVPLDELPEELEKVQKVIGH